MSKIFLYSALLFLAFLLVVFVAACSNVSRNIQQDKKVKITKYVYRYGDRSVPPDYHRSYSIEVSADTTVFTVSTYDKV